MLAAGAVDRENNQTGLILNRNSHWKIPGDYIDKNIYYYLHTYNIEVTRIKILCADYVTLIFL